MNRLIYFLLTLPYFSAAISDRTNAGNSTQRFVPDVTGGSLGANEIRDSRFLGLLNLATFRSGGCRSLSGEVGTCLSVPECMAIRGSSSGLCSGGLGVCCLTSKTCEQVIYANNSYFINQGFPGSFSASGQCSVTVNRLVPQVCQIRLDFEIFSISQPDIVDHNCVTDKFVVTGTTSRIPVICGDNPGQHMYLNVGHRSQSPIILTMITSNLATNLVPVQRNWKIRVSQVLCSGINSGNEAPPGCLQYFTGQSGIIKTFNYFTDAGSTAAARQLSNQDYTICVRQEMGQCAIQYAPCPDPVNNPGHSFTLTGSYTTTNDPVVSLTDSACTTDYVMIPCSTDTNGQYANSDGSVCASRICGGALNSVNAQTVPVNIYSSSVPFELRYHTDGTEAAAGDQGNLGFCLQYDQKPCLPSMNTNIIRLG